MNFATGQSQVDYEQRIDFKSLREYRIGRVNKIMKESEIDALFLWKDENVRYLTSLRDIMLQYRNCSYHGVLLIQDHDPILFASGGELERTKEAMPWIKESFAIPVLHEKNMIDEFIEKCLAGVFEKHNLKKAKIGVDASTFEMIQRLITKFDNISFVEADTLMNKARIIKCEEEIKVMREAAAIADSVTETAIRSIRPGIKEFEIAGNAMKTLFDLGGEFGHLASPFVASGERMAPPTRFPTDKIVRNGDIVFIDIGSSWNGYFGDVGRAFVCGKASEEQKKIYTAVYDSLQTAISSIKPGITNRQLTEKFINTAKKYNLEDHFINLFIGHGIGTAPNEPPYIGESALGAEEVVLEPGMTFALEPLIWVPNVRGGGGVRIEDSVLVTNDGVEVLNRASKDESLLLDTYK